MTIYDEKLEIELNRNLAQRIQELDQKQAAEYEERMNVVNAHLDSFTSTLYQIQIYKRRMEQ